jgi:hypothetical protein
MLYTVEIKLYRSPTSTPHYIVMMFFIKNTDFTFYMSACFTKRIRGGGHFEL